MRLYGKYRGRYGFNGSGFIGYRTRCSFFLLQFFYCKISVLRSLLRLLRTSNLENIREGRTVSEQRDIVLTVQTNVDADRRCRSSAGKDLARSFTGPKHDTVSVLFLAFSILKKASSSTPPSKDGQNCRMRLARVKERTQGRRTTFMWIHSFCAARSLCQDLFRQQMYISSPSVHTKAYTDGVLENQTLSKNAKMTESV
jgi:hypothetical protein